MGTELKTVKGFHGGKNDMLPRRENITVRFTSDKYGKTISLEDGENIIGVPFEDVEKMIKKARKSK